MMKRAVLSVAGFATTLLTASVAFAQEAGGVLSPGDGGLLAIAIALGIGLAAFAGALGQARTAAAALEGIARNPNAAGNVMVPLILGLAFIESLVLFTWVLMLLMQFRM